MKDTYEYLSALIEQDYEFLPEEVLRDGLVKRTGESGDLSWRNCRPAQKGDKK